MTAITTIKGSGPTADHALDALRNRMRELAISQVQALTSVVETSLPSGAQKVTIIAAVVISR